MVDLTQLPPDLPVPEDDGAADHLPGRPLPTTALAATSGGSVALNQLGPGRTVLYVYPLTGRADIDQPDGWDNIPGARGCTAEACDFRDHHGDLLTAGAARVFGLSSQGRYYQHEVAKRLRLPFAMLSDPDLLLAGKLGLPTFRAGNTELYKRLTLVISDGTIEKVFYPVFPPNRHAEQVLAWLGAYPLSYSPMRREDSHAKLLLLIDHLGVFYDPPDRRPAAHHRGHRRPAPVGRLPKLTRGLRGPADRRIAVGLSCR